MIPIDPLKVVGFAAQGIGKIAEKVGKKGVSTLANATDKVVDGTVKQGARKIKDLAASGLKKGATIGKAAGATLLDEAEFVGGAGLHMKSALMGEAPLTSAMFGAKHPVTEMFKKTALMKETDKNLLGVEFSKLGKGAFLVGAVALGSKDAAVEYSNSRRGQSDGIMYTNTPSMQFGGQSFSSMGASYANNGGATGDLGFALHNQRRTGMF